MPKLCVCFYILFTNPSLSGPTLPSHTQLFLDSVSFSPDKVESLLSNLDSDSATGPDSISPRVLKTCSAALDHPLSFTQGHLPSGWKSANITTLHKKLQKQILATTDQSAFSKSSARLRNPSSLLTLNASSSPMACFLIINLDSDEDTLPWTCCFCFPNNGWRTSMPDKRSEPYP